MLKGLPVAGQRVVGEVLVEDADAAAPNLVPCNTPEFYNNDEDIDCENVPRPPGTGSPTRRRRR